MKKLVAMIAVLGLTALASPVLADWDVGDPYKYLQLPNPNGWDVSPHDPQSGTFTEAGDDWLCSSTGAVSDVHIWYSWKQDNPHPFDVEMFIYSNVPAGPEPGSFSHPGDMLWCGPGTRQLQPSRGHAVEPSFPLGPVRDADVLDGRQPGMV
jgi:hypothetical protein